MNFIIKSYRLSYLLFIIFIVFSACSSHTEGDGHDHSIKKEKDSTETTVEQKHEEAEPTIVSLNEEQIKTVGIKYGIIEQKQLTATLKANGSLRVPNNNKANATSLYGGAIKTIKVQMGTSVKKGQVIATIINPQFLQLQEEYLSLGSKISFAEQEFIRQKELNAGNAGALKNYQSANAELKALHIRLASLVQQIQLMGINPTSISNTNLRSSLDIKSPISGTISNVFAKIGSYVDVSSPVAEIVDNGQLHLDLNVFEKDLPLLKVGQLIHFTLTNNAVNAYEAKIYSIGTSFENDSKTIPIHATVQGNKTGLIDGMNITAIVSLNNATTAAVPNDAIVNYNAKEYIFAITDKKPEEHHEEGADEHGDSHEGKVEEKEHVHKEGEAHNAEREKMINFEKIEVVKGVSNMGYTAITLVNEISKGAKIVTKGAFFINAKMTNQGEGHEH